MSTIEVDIPKTDGEGNVVEPDNKPIDTPNQNPELTEPTDKLEGDEGEPKDAPEVEEGNGDGDKALSKQVEDQSKADADAKQILSDKGIDFDVLAEEYTTNGNKLSNESYEKLEKAGYPKTVVDTFIAGKQALVNQFSDAIIRHAGGEQEYVKLTNAIRSKGQEAVDAYNALIETGNIPAIKMVLDSVKGANIKKLGTSNPTILGTSRPTVQQGYKNVSDMEKAMRDARYGRDDDYTLEVQNMVAKSQFIKVAQ